MSNTFTVEGRAGERVLAGELSVAGAKNAVLKIMAASMLCSQEVSLTHVPDIEDVARMGELLRKVGVSCTREKNQMTLNAGTITTTTLDRDGTTSMRASILLTGPLLAREGHVQLPHPGGCVIGLRPIDLFVEGFQKMGATVSFDGDTYDMHAPVDGLRGADIFFRVQSQTATETFMLAATLSHGTTVLRNCALEPEVGDLARFLVSCGAEISGIDSSTLIIQGTARGLLNGGTYTTMPDRIETGSFLILGALAAQTLTITHCVPEHVRILIEILKSMGVNTEETADTITVHGTNSLRAVHVRTHEYPGLPTDLQAPLSILLTQAEGESSIFETIFEGRLQYIATLKEMGATVWEDDTHRARIIGPTPLVAHALKAPDIRAGFAFLLAALIAKGTSVIDSIYYVDRGYEAIDKRLRAIGASITRN